MQDLFRLPSYGMYNYCICECQTRVRCQTSRLILFTQFTAPAILRNSLHLIQLTNQDKLKYTGHCAYVLLVIMLPSLMPQKHVHLRIYNRTPVVPAKSVVPSTSLRYPNLTDTHTNTCAYTPDSPPTCPLSNQTLTNQLIGSPIRCLTHSLTD